MVLDTLWASEVTLASWTAEIPVVVHLGHWIGFQRRNDAARPRQRTLGSSLLQAGGVGFRFLGFGFLCRRLTLATWCFGCWRVAGLCARMNWSKIIPLCTVHGRKALAQCWLLLLSVREEIGGGERTHDLC